MNTIMAALMRLEQKLLATDEYKRICELQRKDKRIGRQLRNMDKALVKGQMRLDF